MSSKWSLSNGICCVALASRGFVLAVAASALAVSLFAKMYEEPKSFSLKDESQAQVDRRTLPALDIERLVAEDRNVSKTQPRPGPLRFAIAQDVSFRLDNSGTWQNLADGRLWRLRIQSPRATNHNLGITRFEMPEGAKLWVYDPAHTHVEGPYTALNRSRAGSLWTPVIEGDEIIVEVFAPTGAAQPVIEISKANQGYLGKSGIFAQTEGTCENDVVCPVGNPWHNQIRAVALYTVSGTAACSGTLLNDVPHHLKPYFLSANHCGVDGTNDSTVVVYWNYQSPTCGTHGPGSLADNQTGSTYRASFATSDFLLFELSATPDPTFNVYYAGWDATGTTPPSTVGIHHPSADVKTISFSNTPAIATNPDASLLTDTPSPTGSHWRVNWDSGVTEHGSSGSCLFDTSTQRCIGQLHGGPSACGLPTAQEHDYYGRISVSWEGGGTSATRLKDWLDPGNTGTLGLDGDPHITTANGVHYDFQSAGEFISLRDPDGLEIQTRQSPLSTSNPPTDGHDGLSTCVSINTAVAARVGEQRVTYQPSLEGAANPKGMQLRIDGKLTTLGLFGLSLAGGGSINTTGAPGGLAINFPDASTLLVTPTFWNGPNVWYLNVDVHRPASNGGASPGSFPIGGIAGAIATDSWLPALPDGSSMGSMPAALHDRYLALYQKFANAWRVTDKASLFDYAPGQSTGNFTMLSWPAEHPPCIVPNQKPLEPATEAVAQRACRTVTGDAAHANCVFDVMITGNIGFARTYTLGQKVQSGATRTTVIDNRNPSKVDQAVVFTATVAKLTPATKGVPTGTAQFFVDAKKVGRPVALNKFGQAVWRTGSLKPGTYRVSAAYTPRKGSVFQPSTSPDHVHTVSGGNE